MHHINLLLALVFLFVIGVSIVSLWQYGQSVKRHQEQQNVTDTQQERAHAQQYRAEALLDRQEALLARAEELVRRLEMRDRT